MDRFDVRKRSLESEPLLTSTAARQAPTCKTSHPDRILPTDLLHAKLLEKNSYECNARASSGGEPAKKKTKSRRRGYKDYFCKYGCVNCSNANQDARPVGRN